MIKLVVKCRSKMDFLSLDYNGEDKPLTDRRECTVSFVAEDVKGYRSIDVPVTPAQLTEIEVGQKFTLVIERS